MQIVIAERLKPFSHRPGTRCMLPGSTYSIKIFPASLIIYDLSGEEKILSKITLDIEGPIHGFTVQQDLEKGWIKVWGTTPKGYIRYRLVAAGKKVALIVEKGDVPYLESENIVTEATTTNISGSYERLSLGMHKAQDWEMVQRRHNLAEIFPVWMRLGQLTPDPKQEARGGTAALLNEDIEALSNLFLAGFEGILSPRLSDDSHQGFHLPLPISGDSPLNLLVKGADLIRSLFLKEEGTIHILPKLPVEFHCGRMVNMACADGNLDLEWSKKTIRRMVFHADSNGSLEFVFRKGIKRFRLRKGKGDRGQQLEASSKVEVEQGQDYFFDHFEK